MSARLAVGVGARRGVDPQELAALVRESLARLVPSPRSRGEGWGEGPGVETEVSNAAPFHPLPASGDREWRLFTIDTKQDEAGLHEAARLLHAGIVFLPLEALLARKSDVLTLSARVEELLGVGSVAEAAALAGAGPGSRLLGPRIATRTLTCAIAQNTRDETP